MKKLFVTTSWDDGHVLDLTLAEALRKHHVRGTFYISPEDREIPPNERLTREQVAMLAKDFEIGAHTVTHPRLRDVDDISARDEIVDSKKILEEILGRQVKSFCYPGGSFGPEHERMVREAGFSLARTVERFATDAGTDPFAMPTTIHAYRHWSDLSPILESAGPSGFVRQYLNWDQLAIAMFDRMLAGAGAVPATATPVFHLWGHSWEIDRNGDWQRLERVLAHISNRPDVEYVSNGELPVSP